MISAIVYRSNTGFTERYAKYLSYELNIPCISLKNSRKILKRNDEIVF